MPNSHLRRIMPTSPDGTDWSLYGDSAHEQWNGVHYEAQLEDAERSSLVEGTEIESNQFTCRPESF